MYQGVCEGASEASGLKTDGDENTEISIYTATHDQCVGLKRYDPSLCVVQSAAEKLCQLRTA